jgi:hypothetical protein
MFESANEFVLSAIVVLSGGISTVLIASVSAGPINAEADRTKFRRLSGAPQAVR